MNLFPELNTVAKGLMDEYPGPDAGRKNLLDSVAAAVRKQLGPLFLNFICTHNSRRSQLGQAWAQAAAYYHDVDGIFSVSGGTEVSAFHPNTIAALKRQGFHIELKAGDTNPVYNVRFSSEAPSLEMYSKLFGDAVPSGARFLAMMVCNQADAACPFVPGNSGRFQLNYSDPGAFDGKPGQDAAYDERARQIASEMLYVFSKVKGI